jgi:iron complex transport system ATP-binding protein
MTLLGASDVSVAFNGHKVVDRVSVTLARGELVGLIGPNGAGKTTLIRTLAGVLAPTAGTVRFDGRPIADMPRRELARRLAYMAQGADCHWPLTVERVVALGRLPHLAPWQRPGEDDRRAIRAALEAADMTGFAGRRATSLSAGERARALLARALAVEPAALLADEPVAALDPGHQLDLMTLLHRRARDGAAVVVVLHDLSLAARFCHRLVLLHRSRVLAEGAPETVLTAATLAEAYGIEALIGRQDGEPYVVPWRVVGARAAPEAAP